MADPLPWPSVLVPSSEDWSARGGTRSGGQTFEGNEQVAASPTARWKATLTVPCLRREQVMAMRRVIALGRTVSWLIGPCEATRAPWNIDFLGGKVTYGQGQKDAAANPAFETDPSTSSVLDFKLAQFAGMNGTVLQVQRTRGGILEPGMMLQIQDRLHIIVALPGGELALPGQQGPAGIVPVEIRPWLRQDCDAGTVVEFGRPVGRMRLASDDTGAMELQLSRYGTVTVEFVEAF